MQSLLEWKHSQKPKSSADSVARASKEVQSEESLRLAKATAQQPADSQTGYPNANVGPLPDSCWHAMVIFGCKDVHALSGLCATVSS